MRAQESEVKALCRMAMDVLTEEGNVQQVESPVTVRSLLFTLSSEPPSLLAPRPAARCFLSRTGVLSFGTALTLPHISDMRRHPWPVLRFTRALPCRR